MICLTLGVLYKNKQMWISYCCLCLTLGVLYKKKEFLLLQEMQKTFAKKMMQTNPYKKAMQKIIYYRPNVPSASPNKI